MRLHPRDIVWIVTFVLAGILFVNMAVGNYLRATDREKQRSVVFHRITETRAGTAAVRISGGQNPKDMPPASPPGGAPELPFELRGTVIGTPSLAYIFARDSQSNNSYRLRDTVSGYTIADITQGKVVLRKNDSYFTLTMNQSSRGARTREEEQIPRQETFEFSRVKLLTEIGRVNDVLAKIKIMPVRDADSESIRGFRIDDVPPGSILEEAGVKSGDIVCAVQGKNIESIQDAWEMINRLKDTTEVQVGIRRADKPLTLHYKVHN